MYPYVAALACVLGMAIGQLLFKLAAGAVEAAGTFFAPRPLLYLAGAMLLYGATSIAWVRLLQGVALGRVYPVMALAFVLVPLGSWLMFGERFEPRYFAGVALIVAGIVLTLRA
jgi:drug/metabolite transporter (DMT)-like permease